MPVPRLGKEVGSGTGYMCVLGRNCSLGQNVYVGNDVSIKNNLRFQNNVSVYDTVTLEDDVFCGLSMVFSNVINQRSAIERKDEYRPTLVKRGTTLGANCTIVCGVTVGEFTFVGAGAVITKDVRPYALVVGVPARQVGWNSRFRERLSIPVGEEGTTVCTESGETYSVQSGGCVLVE